MTASGRGFQPSETVAHLSAELAAGRETAGDLARRSLDRIAETQAAGSLAFTRTFAGSALMDAASVDRDRASVSVASPIGGLPISIKDLFDIAGCVTRAGSALLQDRSAASADAAAVERLRKAGAIVVGMTNMTEFAFANTGVNRTFGTPLNPGDRTRLAGGSSSGAAVSVAEGSVVAALGTDTGGSIRGPAALCGLAGFKPSSGRIPIDGVFPLSPSFDTVGPIARTIRCCSAIDAVLGGDAASSKIALPSSTFGIPHGFMLDNLDRQVERDFARTVTALSSAGATIVDFDWPEVDDPEWWTAYKVILRFESFSWHSRIFGDFSRYPPRLQKLMEAGAKVSPQRYEWAIDKQKRFAEASHRRIAPFAAVLSPTVPILPPRLSELDDFDGAEAVEYLIGRNCEPANFLDLCSCTMPMMQPAALPTGLQVMAARGSDRRLLAVAAAIERILLAC